MDYGIQFEVIEYGACPTAVRSRSTGQGQARTVEGDVERGEFRLSGDPAGAEVAAVLGKLG